MSKLVLVLGKRGMGKSFRLRKLLSEQARVILYDTLKEPTYNSFQRIEDFPTLCQFLSENRPVFQVAYSWPGDCEREEDFERVCKAVYCCRSLVFAVDEIDQFVAPSFMPRHLDMIVSLGRHRDISFYGASRRPKEIHPLIRAQSHEIISFQQTEPNDLDWMRQVIGPLADKLPQLRPHKCIVWTDQTPLDKSAAPVIEDNQSSGRGIGGATPTVPDTPPVVENPTE